MGFENDLKLTKENIQENKSKRASFKLLGNAMLGKFSQRQEYSQTIFVNSQEQIEEAFQKHEVVDLLPISENICELEILPQFANQKSRTGNCVIGAFVTAYARIQLHKDMMLLNSRGFHLYYCDTDGIIFADPNVTLRRTLPLPLSPCLGDYKNELGNDVTIESFACLARKTYSITFVSKLEKESQICIKSSGLSLSSKLAQNALNYSDFKTLLSNFAENPMSVEVPQLRSFVIKNTNTVQQKISRHKVSNHLNVQRFVTNVSNPTLPFGYNYGGK